MQPPIKGHVVLGWDPAFRTGCKLAVVDETGKVIGTTVIYPTAPTTPQKMKAAADLLKKIIPKYHEMCIRDSSCIAAIGVLIWCTHIP